MSQTALVLTCLACVCHSRELQNSSAHVHSNACSEINGPPTASSREALSTVHGNCRFQPPTALSTLLLTSNPVAAFNSPRSAALTSRRTLHPPQLVNSRCPIEAIRCSGGAINALLKRQWERYNRANDEHPWATKMATSAILASTGDIIAQYLEGASVLAIKRLLSLVIVNVFYIVPMLSILYGVNERVCTKLVGTERGTWKSTGVLLAFDQGCIAPFGIHGFFWSFGLVTSLLGVPGAPALGTLYSHTIAELKAKYLSTLFTNWKIWVLPQILNFALVPPGLRVSFANCVALVWNVVISMIANKK